MYVSNGPISAPGAVIQSGPQREASSAGDLLYVVTSDATYMLTYPGGKKVATLKPKGSLGFVCPDETNGDVYFDTHSGIVKYAHGGISPIGQIDAPPSAYTIGCAADPTTDDLAVTYQLSGSKRKGWVAVYAGGSGTPTDYTDKNISLYAYCGYDNQGDLFVDGLDENNNFLLAELPKGSSTFTDIMLNEQISNDTGPVQWDGTYITVEVPRNPTIYRIAVSGSNGTVTGKTTLRNRTKTKNIPNALTWIQEETVLAGEGGPKNPNVGYWNYPAGGKAYKVISGLAKAKKDGVYNVAVSLAPSQ